MILFHSEGIDFKLQNKRKLKDWIKRICEENDKKVGEINFIFKNDEGLHEINMQYLSHDTYTDIITFDNSEIENVIDSDIFISVERVKANALELRVDFEEELRRVLIHGILHLCGFKDKTKYEALLMRKTENEALNRYEY